MKLRTKLLLAHTPVLAALVVIVVTAAYITWRLGDTPGSILRENFRSFDAGRGMLVAIGAIDRDVVAPPWREADETRRAIIEQRAVELRNTLARHCGACVRDRLHMLE